MPRRDTTTEKWDEKWFRQLSVNAKLMYFFLQENCDIAGFIKVDFEVWSVKTKMSEEVMLDSLKELGADAMTRKEVIWLPNFIESQRNGKLSVRNNCHLGIIKRLKEQKSLFPEVKTLLRPLGDPSEGLVRPKRGSREEVMGNVVMCKNNKKGVRDKTDTMIANGEYFEALDAVGCRMDYEEFMRLRQAFPDTDINWAEMIEDAVTFYLGDVTGKGVRSPANWIKSMCKSTKFMRKKPMTGNGLGKPSLKATEYDLEKNRITREWDEGKISDDEMREKMKQLEARKAVLK